MTTTAAFQLKNPGLQPFDQMLPFPDPHMKLELDSFSLLAPILL